MKIACLGGGPARLYFTISMKLLYLSDDLTVIERNKADDTFDGVWHYLTKHLQILPHFFQLNWPKK